MLYNPYQYHNTPHPKPKPSSSKSTYIFIGLGLFICMLCLFGIVLFRNNKNKNNNKMLSTKGVIQEKCSTQSNTQISQNVTDDGYTREETTNTNGETQTERTNSNINATDNSDVNHTSNAGVSSTSDFGNSNTSSGTNFSGNVDFGDYVTSTTEDTNKTSETSMNDTTVDNVQSPKDCRNVLVYTVKNETYFIEIDQTLGNVGD